MKNPLKYPKQVNKLIRNMTEEFGSLVNKNKSVDGTKQV